MRMPLLTREAQISAVVDDTHQGALDSIAALFCLAISLLFLCARLLIRWPWRTLFGLDDAVLTVATTIQASQVIVIVRAVDKGLGSASDSLSSNSASSIKKSIYAARLLFVLSLYTGKLSVALFFRRLGAKRDHQLYSTVLAALCCILGSVSFLTLAIEPNVSAPWLMTTAEAGSVLDRWIAVQTFASILDVLMCIFPIYLVKDLQMPMSHKAQAVIGVWSRLILIIIAILALVSLRTALHHQDFIFNYVNPEIYLQAEMCYNLVTATIPSLRSFLRMSTSGIMGEVPKSHKADSYFLTFGSDGRGQKASKIMASRRSDEEPIELTNIRQGHTVTKAGRGYDQNSMTSDSSQTAIVVRRTVDVAFDAEAASQRGEEQIVS